jgi:hypothetical protein
MAYWRSIKFWALLIVGWLIASMFFSILARFFASFDDLTRAQLWITGITIHVLALLAGFSFARSKVRRDNPPGFPVVVKSDGGPDAE